MDFIAGNIVDIVLPIPVGAFTNNFFSAIIVLYAAAAGFDDALWGALFEYVFGKAGVGYMTGIPEHVEIIRRGSRLFIINHLNKQVNISLEGSFTAIAGPYDNGRLRLEPYAVTILEDCGKSFLKTGPPSRNE